jgi:hypothetical protein
MNKEKALNDLIDLVNHISELKPEQRNDIKILEDLKIKSDSVRQAVASLNSCDADWVNDEYGKWWKKVFYPKHKALIDNINKNLTSVK